MKLGGTNQAALTDFIRKQDGMTFFQAYHDDPEGIVQLIRTSNLLIYFNRVEFITSGLPVGVRNHSNPLTEEEVNIIYRHKELWSYYRGLHIGELYLDTQYSGDFIRQFIINIINETCETNTGNKNISHRALYTLWENIKYVSKYVRIDDSPYIRESIPVPDIIKELFNLEYFVDKTIGRNNVQGGAKLRCELCGDILTQKIEESTTNKPVHGLYYDLLEFINVFGSIMDKSTSKRV